MDIKSISPTLSISQQITVDQIQTLADEGFRSIICNRPDGEGADQHTFEEIEKAAHRIGLDARYIPVVVGKMTNEDAIAFDNAMQELPKPTLAYCRTGRRSETLWSLNLNRKHC